MTVTEELTVSVALATYNGSKFIREQLDSIARQDLQPNEIVICDDVSSDLTVDIVKDFQRGYAGSIRLYENESQMGYVKNFEQAISICRGDIIALCDQDDVWLPEKLRKMAELFVENAECGMVYSDAIVVNSELKPLGYTVYSRHGKPNLSSGNVVYSHVKKMRIKGASIAFRAKYRDYILPITSQWWGHDRWISFILAVISKIYAIDIPLMLYRRHGGNVGVDTLLDNQIKKTLRQKYRDMSVEFYHRDYEMWRDMLGHLETLREKESGGDDFDENNLDAGIEIVKGRGNYAEQRMELQKQGRLSRAIPLIGLLLDRKYHQYGRGVRSFTKDLIA